MTTYANPGAIGDVPPTPNKIETTWGNAIRDRIINNFASAAARDAAITSPVLGQFCYVAGTGFLQYAGPTDGWRPPWNLPWGEIAYSEITSASAAFTTIADIITVTFTAVAHRYYRVEIDMNCTSTVADDIIHVDITDGSNASKRAADVVMHINGRGNPLSLSIRQLGLAAGSQTFKLRATRSVGTGSCTVSGSATNPSCIRVEDLGPNGDPS